MIVCLRVGVTGSGLVPSGLDYDQREREIVTANFPNEAVRLCKSDLHTSELLIPSSTVHNSKAISQSLSDHAPRALPTVTALDLAPAPSHPSPGARQR